jgi:hypothetical protein
VEGPLDASLIGTQMIDKLSDEEAYLIARALSGQVGGAHCAACGHRCSRHLQEDMRCQRQCLAIWERFHDPEQHAHFLQCENLIRRYAGCAAMQALSLLSPLSVLIVSQQLRDDQGVRAVSESRRGAGARVM